MKTILRLLRSILKLLRRGKKTELVIYNINHAAYQFASKTDERDRQDRQGAYITASFLITLFYLLWLAR